MIRRIYLVVPVGLLRSLLVLAAILASPLALVVCLVESVNPLPALAASWEMAGALGGTHVEVNKRGRSVSIEIR